MFSLPEASGPLRSGSGSLGGREWSRDGRRPSRNLGPTLPAPSTGPNLVDTPLRVVIHGRDLRTRGLFHCLRGGSTPAPSGTRGVGSRRPEARRRRGRPALWSGLRTRGVRKDRVRLRGPTPRPRDRETPRPRGASGVAPVDEYSARLVYIYRVAKVGGLWVCFSGVTKTDSPKQI